MNKKFKFKLSRNGPSTYPDAEALFRDLRNRDPKIQHLWSHQADIIRSYHREVDHSDVALELPTGAGKTLVGLLIAGWRRSSLHDRVAYLCPTRQLAYQVGLKAKEYDIKAHVLVGSKSQYPAAALSDYASASAIAIMTYSGLFNIKPKIDNPQTIILDDAHAGENYIAGMWSLSISRSDHKALYDQFINLFAKELPSYLTSDLMEDNPTPHQRLSADMLPSPKLFQHIQALTDLLDAATDDTNLIFPWQIIRNHLRTCGVFFTWSDILIRPWIPPTLTHPPFASAKQRVYMSATIGAGGELERITGVPRIHRIPVPSGWDKQGTGRRLFVFPDRSFEETDYEPWLADILRSNERTLVLTPHGLALSSFLTYIGKSGVQQQVLRSKDVEEAMDVFTESSGAILVLTNRYDGIDLPGDTCRVLVVYGLPASVNSQERFLWSKLGLVSLLNDRVRTRITQAVGRCTRNSTDYAIAVMIGGSLLDFCIKRENRLELHPEMRAEMEFGLENSDVGDIGELAELVKLFLRRDSSWDEAESDIVKRRDETICDTPPYVGTLRDVVHLEVGYQYDLWKEDYESALSRATDIVDQLSGDTLAPYRALWNYFAGCAAYQLVTITGKGELQATASERFDRAAKASRTVSWFARLAQELGVQHEGAIEYNYPTMIAAESINTYLTNLGMVGKKFDKLMTENSTLIEATSATRFDRGLTELGKMLGFDAIQPKGSGVPDSVWRLGSEYVLLFECKSDEAPSDGISITTCRQSHGHQDWQKANPFFTQSATMVTIVISPRKYINKDALPHAAGLFYQHVDQIRSLFREAQACIRVIRSKCTETDSETRIQIIQDEFAGAKLIPGEIILRLSSVKLSDLDCK